MGNHSEKDNNNDPNENKNNINKEQPSDNEKDKKDKDDKPEDINNPQNLEITNDENIYFIETPNKTNKQNNISNIFKINKSIPPRRNIRNIYVRKFTKDNIMRKLKGYFFNYIIDLIRKKLINKDIRLKKISYRAESDLTYKNNERLLKMKISDILYEVNKDEYYNRKIIDKIYEEKKERNVIKIFELTFEELFIIFRRKLNDSEDLKKLEEIKDKIKGLDLLENNEYQDIQYFIEKDIKRRYRKPGKYIEKIKTLCLSYQKWFNNKIGRAIRKKCSIIYN